MKSVHSVLILVCAMTLIGCVAPTSYDYSAFRESKPASILVLPPLNNTTEVAATAGFYAQTTYPLAESGYYVFPVAVVTETFRQNGLEQAADIHALPTAKLHEVFKSDAALYIELTEYGTSYVVISSETRVTATAKLVDLRSGALLWEGKATASSAEQRSSGGGGLVGLLVEAAVNQIMETVTDRSYQIAAITNARLLSAGMPNGILYGPRSPYYAGQK